MGLFWDEVEFNYAAAQNAVEALQYSATRLNQASEQRARQAKDARLDWSGATRVRFDQTLDPALRQAADLVAALRRAAGTIRKAMAEATAEQQRLRKARAEFRAHSEHR
jgi:uncharacterized protein YukE